MIIQTHQNLTQPDERRVSRLVVYDELKQPVAVFVQVSPTHLFMTDRSKPDFHETLAHLGINDTAVVTTVSKESLRLV